jgi:GABA(A) receptor-associated protein
MKKDYRSVHTFEERLREATNVLIKYKDRIPIIVDVQDPLYIDKVKYLVPKTLSLGQFSFVLRKRMKLLPENAIFMFVDGEIPPFSSDMNSIYNNHRSNDGFLYINVATEKAYGGN